MKATDLMLGDYVTVKTPIEEKTEKVAEIYPKGIITEDGGSYLEDEIIPVPLTPEILEKNGFSQDPLNGHIFIFHDKSGEVIYYEYGPKYGLTIDNKIATIQDLKIKYVHELQHALRLCGIDKEIEL